MWILGCAKNTTVGHVERTKVASDQDASGLRPLTVARSSKDSSNYSD